MKCLYRKFKYIVNAAQPTAGVYQRKRKTTPEIKKNTPGGGGGRQDKTILHAVHSSDEGCSSILFDQTEITLFLQGKLLILIRGLPAARSPFRLLRRHISNKALAQAI